MKYIVKKKNNLPDFEPNVFFFNWQMAQPFVVQNVNFEQKRGSRFLFKGWDLSKSGNQKA